MEDSRIIHAENYIDMVIKELDYISVLLANGYTTLAKQKIYTALVHLGTLLHPLQDILAHTDKVSKFKKVVSVKNPTKKNLSYYKGSYGWWYHDTNKGIDSVSKHKETVLKDVKFTTCLILSLLSYKYPFL